MINPWMILPFGLLLACIAVMPLLASHWWEHHYPKVSLGLGTITLGYYLFVIKDFHPLGETVHEYVSFICLIGSLFVVSGGIIIRVKGESTPMVNVIMLAIGGVIANVLGTTGASMLLIRPYLRANKYRLTAFHVVFFIFIVSNVGGSLTPIGDPPLYLGYLKGIPFFWTAHALYLKWALGLVFLLCVFYILDRRNFLKAPREVREKETAHEEWHFEGLHNIIWLAVILCSLFLNHPHFAREAIMIATAFLSWMTTRKTTYEGNNFSWAPIKEVSILFIGIFITMMPALAWLEHNASTLGISSPGSFYWGSGLLSAFLDNAPTYLNFLSASLGLFVREETVQAVQHFIANHSDLTSLAGSGMPEDVINTLRTIHDYHPEFIAMTSIPEESIRICYLIGNHWYHIAAISIGSVFFGACTYIGNGPNFMVKSIAEHSGVRMPSFFGYIFKYTIPFFLPLLILVWLIFFRSHS